MSAAGLEPATNGLKAYWGSFALNDQEPAFSVQDTGLEKNEDTGRIVNPFVDTL